MLLQLKFKTLPFESVKAIYTVKGIKEHMPDGMRALAPDVAEAYERDLKDVVVVSDMLRTGEQSLKAVKAKRGAQPPGYSGHNVGLSIDIVIKALMKALGVRTKRELDAWMAKRGWFCHRVDGALAAEGWHYNYLGVNFVIRPGMVSTNVGLQAEIAKRYPMLVGVGVDNKTIQECLHKLKKYDGAIDGILGPKSAVGLKSFQGEFNLPATGTLDPKTQRTLIFMAADRIYV